jgi:beta-glucosidase
MFPNLCNVGATWDKELVAELGDGLARDCLEHNIQMLLAPGINIKRHILCGRNFEYLAEDPILAGELGAAYINGMQDLGVGTSLKHFAMNNQETFREYVSVEADERTIREIYLKGFEIAVKKANPTSVMCAYNKIFSRWCSENSWLLKEVLKKEWGYDGFVISDWGAVHDSCKAVKGGTDLRMPHHGGMVEDIVKGVSDADGDYVVIEDRRKAIQYAMDKAEKNDIIVLAGKGHETYQEICGVKYPMDERQIVASYL